MSAPAMCEEAGVGVGVVLGGSSEGEDCVAIGDDGRGLIYTSGRNQEAASFSFDQVVNVDNVQSLHAELLRCLPDSIAAGYNAALLMCGVPSPGQDPAPIRRSIVKKLLADVFGRFAVSAQAKDEDLFVSVSSLQFHPDGRAVDVLGPNKRNLTLVQHPVLGSLIGGMSEVCVCSEAEAYSLYETCREVLRATPGPISSRCSSLFSLAVERRLHPEEAESEVQRCRLQLFSLAGGASRTDLRGVNPLVKAVDQISCGAATAEQLLQLLLHEALTGNCRAALICCIDPQGLLDDETPSALALAQRVRGLGNRATAGRWNPREAEREIRGEITELQTEMMSHGGGGHDPRTQRLAELTQHLQTVKSQSWEKRREESKRIKSQAQSRRTHKHDGGHRGGDTEKGLLDQLRLEMMEHIREGRVSVEKVQERIGRVQELREALREETLRNGAVPEKSDLCQQPRLEHNKAEERRRRLKEDHGRLIQQEVEKMERDLAQEQLPPEGPQRELLVLTRERQVLVLQMEALRVEALLAERDLREQHDRHQGELCRLRGESLQVFRAFRQVSEEQRRLSEGRYRGVLLEAVQDAVHLSAQNQQLLAENKQLHKALGELRDALAVRADPKAKA